MNVNLEACTHTSALVANFLDLVVVFYSCTWAVCRLLISSLFFFRCFPVILQELQYNCSCECLHAQEYRREVVCRKLVARVNVAHRETGQTLHGSTNEGAQQSSDEW